MASTDDGNVLVHHNGPESDGTSRSTTRIRSRVACRGCNHRKVRCDVSRKGVPCSNCVHEAASCEVLPRKKHKPRGDRKALQSSRPITQHDPGNNILPHAIAASTSTSTSQDNLFVSQNVHDSPVEKSISYVQRDMRGSASQLLGPTGPRPPSLQSSPVSYERHSSRGLTAPIDAGEVLPDDSSLSYIGDTRGPRFFVYDLCHPRAPQDAMPYLYPRESEISWKPHEVEYLRHQGAFTTLPDDVCDDLIRCYFHHVHFFWPIVDAASFLNEYNSNGRQNISLLLWWSMLLAATNFVEPDVLRRAGFSTRKAMKTAMYDRAKCLYDLDHGTDKLVIIQSVLLMGFWYSDRQDHTGAWYWIGIVITLCQNLGLHRCANLNNRSQPVPEVQQSLIRCIWWSCVVRDRWLSLAKGRPMRIHHEDCDVPIPVAEDILNNLNNISPQTKDKFIPRESQILARMWTNLVEISATLGRILRIHYRVNFPKPLVEDIDNFMEQLKCCKPREMLRENPSELVCLHAYHVELFYEATVAVLYRPYVLSGPSALPLEAPTAWQKTVVNQARAAASSTNSVLEKIIELDAIHLLKPMIITTLIPAMQIHLLDCKSPVALRRGLGSNKLNLCMLVLSQLASTYWSASVMHRLFERAKAIVDKSNSPSAADTAKSTVSSNRMESHLNGQDVNIEAQQHQDHQQQQVVTEDYMRPLSDSNLTMNEHGAPFWINDPSSFSNVDQLLSPGFSIYDSVFLSLLAGYDNGAVRAPDEFSNDLYSLN